MNYKHLQVALVVMMIAEKAYNAYRNYHKDKQYYKNTKKAKKYNF